MIIVYTDRQGFERMVYRMARDLLCAKEVKVGTWQAQDVSQRPEMVSYEVRHSVVEVSIPQSRDGWAAKTKANLPWAEDHFQERVGGKPLNPPPSESYWPFAQQGNVEHKVDQIFSHTYPERFWPKYANQYSDMANRGIRYQYGDLIDVLNLMIGQPETRQAYLPIFFPEDTGAVMSQRIPCTLGYHFLWREGYLDITYHIRSCDFMRHWRDDVYMAGRLCQWMCEHLINEEIITIPGRLVMNIGSLHIFAGDLTSLRLQQEERYRWLEAEFSHKVQSAL